MGVICAKVLFCHLRHDSVITFITCIDFAIHKHKYYLCQLKILVENCKRTNNGPKSCYAHFYSGHPNHLQMSSKIFRLPRIKMSVLDIPALYVSMNVTAENFVY